MNPHQKNKIDINKLSEDEQKIFRLYGKVPSRGELLQNKLKERKYFDSGDYALSKAGKASDVGVTNIGSQHPLPENIPHLSSPGPQNGGGGGGSVGVGHGSNGSGGNNNNSSSTSAANGSNVYGVSGGGGVNGTGPAKEGSLLQKTVSAENGLTQTRNDDGVISPGKEVPVRWQS